MGTHSRIAVLQEKNGSVKSVFCHWDGYLSGVGENLLRYYNTYERANALIALGNLESVYKYLEPFPEAFEARTFNPEIITTHTVERPQRDVTVAWHRDGKGKLIQHKHRSLNDFYKNEEFLCYNYLFKDGLWLVMSEDIKQGEWVTLTPDLVEEEK